jgi:hypothetical protein
MSDKEIATAERTAGASITSHEVAANGGQLELANSGNRAGLQQVRRTQSMDAVDELALAGKRSDGPCAGLPHRPSRIGRRTRLFLCGSWSAIRGEVEHIRNMALRANSQIRIETLTHK